MASTSSDAEVIALRQELAALRDADVARQQELDTLRAEFAAFRAALTQTNEQQPMPAGCDDSATHDDHESSGGMTSRRSLLKWGGLGAAAALAAAGGTALTSQTARASNGNNLILGQQNVAENTTSLTYDGLEEFPLGLVVDLSNISNGSAVRALAGQGTGGANAAIGVYGSSTAVDFSFNVMGIYGSCDNSIGIYGASSTSYAIMGVSGTGIDLAAQGTGRLIQNHSGFVGAPTSGSYTQGEQIRDNKGDLYICIATGSPGTWHKVAAGTPGISGAITFLANPIRLLDTRSGSPWTAGSTHSFQVTGVTVSGLKVPTGAIGVVGNLTVTQPSAGGDLRLYPGASAPATSSINFATNWTIANGVTIGLNSSGQLNVRVDMPSGAHTHVLFDASGYIL